MGIRNPAAAMLQSVKANSLPLMGIRNPPLHLRHGASRQISLPLMGIRNKSAGGA